MFRLTSLLAGASLLAALPAFAGADCQPRDFGFGDKSVGWQHKPLSKMKSDTRYQIVADAGRSVLHASADDSASLYIAQAFAGARQHQLALENRCTACRCRQP